MRSLNYRQRMFVEAYLGEAAGSATEAARLSGYAQPHMSGPRMMAKDGVKAAIEARVASATMSANEVLARLADIAAADPLDFIAIDTSGEWVVNLTLAKRRGKGHLIKRIKKTQFGTELEFKDSVVALTRIGEYLGLWNREKPPEISLVELAKALKDRDERLRSVDNPGEPSGQLQE